MARNWYGASTAPVNRCCNLLLLSRADATDLGLQHGLKTAIATFKKTRSLLSALAAPIEDRLFFAGEATALDFPSTVHGAYLSGLRAAQSILDL